MKRFLILAALAAVAAPAAISGLGGEEVAPAPAWLEGGDAGLQAYRAAKIYVDGTTVHEDAYLLVRDGKVAAIVADEAELPPFLELKDLGDVTVMPGLVAADSPLTGNGNQGDRSMAAHRRAYDDFDPFLDMDRVLERGITTFYLSPDRRRLVGGRGAVVKAAGADRVRGAASPDPASPPCPAKRRRMSSSSRTDRVSQSWNSALIAAAVPGTPSRTAGIESVWTVTA